MSFSWSNRKKLIVALLVTIINTLILSNIASYAALRYIYNVDIYDNSSYRDYKKKNLFDNRNGTIVHPYIGKMELGSVPFQNGISTEPLFERIDKASNPSDIRILILGGSVAAHLSVHPESAGLFARKLNERFNTDKFSVYNAAFGGGKQPQQYFKMLYLDLLGFTPDIVINYDGFNEIALPIAENHVLKNPAIFPRAYSLHLDTSSDAGRACTIFSDKMIESGSHTPLAALIVHLYAQLCKNNLERISLPWWSDFLGNGDIKTYAQRSHEIWRESSNRIYDFTRAHGIDYIHVLQPNQYYPDSKPLSDDEKAQYVSLGNYGEPIRTYYWMLSRDGIETEHFYDQRLIFKYNNNTVYSDSCCHFNKAGMDTIADDIIERFYNVFKARLHSAESSRAINSHP